MTQRSREIAPITRIQVARAANPNPITASGRKPPVKSLCSARSGRPLLGKADISNSVQTSALIEENDAQLPATFGPE